MRKKQFCSHSCANNRGSTICPRCGKHKVCRSCWEELNGIGNKTLGYYTSKCQEIRTNARRVLESSEREKVCHKFDAILDHLKGILEFDEDRRLTTRII